MLFSSGVILNIVRSQTSILARLVCSQSNSDSSSLVRSSKISCSHLVSPYCLGEITVQPAVPCVQHIHCPTLLQHLFVLAEPSGPLIIAGTPFATSAVPPPAPLHSPQVVYEYQSVPSWHLLPFPLHLT